MQSRRDQLQAYRFLTRRALAALVAGEPDLPEAPMRRLSITTVTGIMVAILVAAGFAVVGFVRPGSKTTISSGTIYIERDTGAQFVLLSDGLHPALNYASAVLAASAAGGQGQVGVKTVPTSVLAQKPHGSPIGIAGLPQSLPRGKSGLIGTPWTICSKTSQQSVDNNVVSVSVAVGSDGGAHRLPPDAAAVVTTPGSSDRYLVWHGKRLQIAPEVDPALGLPPAVVVGRSLFNALSPGSLGVPKIANAGRPGPHVGSTPALIGQLIHVTNANPDFYRVVLSDGRVSRPITSMQAHLLQAMRLNGRPLNPISTTEAVSLTLPQSTQDEHDLSQFSGLPSEVPQVPDSVGQAGGVCVGYDRNSQPTLAYPSGSTEQASTALTPSDPDHAAQGIADSVDVPAGKAALVWDGRSATRYIVAAPGMRFAVNANDLGSFGFGGATPLKLPAQWLNLLPSGPAFDRCKIVTCN